MFFKVPFYCFLTLGQIFIVNFGSISYGVYQTRAILLGGVSVLGDIGVLLKIGIGIGYC